MREDVCSSEAPQKAGIRGASTACHGYKRDKWWRHSAPRPALESIIVCPMETSILGYVVGGGIVFLPCPSTHHARLCEGPFPSLSMPWNFRSSMPFLLHALSTPPAATRPLLHLKSHLLASTRRHSRLAATLLLTLPLPLLFLPHTPLLPLLLPHTPLLPLLLPHTPLLLSHAHSSHSKCFTLAPRLLLDCHVCHHTSFLCLRLHFSKKLRPTR